MKMRYFEDEFLLFANKGDFRIGIKDFGIAIVYSISPNPSNCPQIVFKDHFYEHLPFYSTRYAIKELEKEVNENETPQKQP
jgi:hypothetical protein